MLSSDVPYLVNGTARKRSNTASQGQKVKLQNTAHYEPL